jgi:hypothetical protein
MRERGREKREKIERAGPGCCAALLFSRGIIVEMIKMPKRG